MTAVRRLLTVGHSYVVAQNRRLAHEMAKVGKGRWDITVASPRFVRGNLRSIPFETIADEASHVRTFPMYLSASPHFSFYSRSLRDLVRANWELVHVWEEPYVTAGFQVCRWVRPDVPLVFWTMQNINKWYPPPNSWFEKYCLGKCRGWEAGGQTIAETLVSRGYTKRPHRVISLGVDLEAFRADTAVRETTRRQLGWEVSGPPVIGYSGRFTPEKGVSSLMQSLDALATPWRALFVGGGRLESQLRRWANRYSDNRVKIVTKVPHDCVPNYLRAMDVLAAPSQTTARWREQFGRMLIEAMACGVPVVGSSSGEIPYVLGESGVVLSEVDVAAWTATLGELLDSPQRRLTLAKLGLQRVKTEYAWPIVADRHLDFFDELLENRYSG